MYIKVSILSVVLYHFKGKFSIGLGVCLDMRYPEISRIYTQRGKYSVYKRHKNM
jgi:predicted amidohydrolase